MNLDALEPWSLGALEPWRFGPQSAIIIDFHDSTGSNAPDSNVSGDPSDYNNSSDANVSNDSSDSNESMGCIRTRRIC